MPVSQQEYADIIRQEMKRVNIGGRRGEEGGQSARNAAVRRANIRTGYGNSTALKHRIDGRGGQQRPSQQDRGGKQAPPSGGKKKAPGKTVVDDNIDLPQQTSAIPTPRPGDEDGGFPWAGLLGAGGIAGLIALLSRSRRPRPGG